MNVTALSTEIRSELGKLPATVAWDVRIETGPDGGGARVDVRNEDAIGVTVIAADDDDETFRVYNSLDPADYSDGHSLASAAERVAEIVEEVLA